MAPAAGGTLAMPPPPSIVATSSAHTGNHFEAQRGQRNVEESGDDEDDDDVNAIRRISISVDATDSASSSSSSRAGNGSAAPSGASTSSSASKPSMSSLRSLLGVPANGTAIRPPSAPTKASSSGGLAVPASTTAATAPHGIGGAPSARIGGNGLSVASSAGDALKVNKDGQQILPSEIAPKRKKVVLGPGCSALDWARRKGEIAVQRQQCGAIGMRRVTPSELKKHNTREDAWSAFQGKVYDMTPYLRFHPGGIDELMRVAGRDGTRLFMLTHSWVNVDAMIDACCIGILVSEPA